MPPTLPIPLPELVRLLSAHYGVDAKAIFPLALDHAPTSLAARVETYAGKTFFLKFKREIVPGSLTIPALLHAQSVPVLAPLPALTHDLFVQAGDFFLLLYPFLNASAVDYRSLTPAQWRDLGLALRRIHATPPPEALRAVLPHATFTPWGEHFIAECAEAFVHRGPDLQALWQTNQELLKDFYAFTWLSGHAARSAAPAFHLCHNDFHSGNVLLDSATGDLTIIDWDNPAWGPRERDLLFIAPDNRLAFEVGYGPLDEVPEVARYVHADWLLQDILDCFSRLLPPNLMSSERDWAIDCISSLAARMHTFLELH